MILCRVERLVDPVHAAGHVTGVAGDQHQVADGEQECSSPEEKEETALLTDFTVFPGSVNVLLFLHVTWSTKCDYLASRRIGSSGGYMDLTTSSTLQEQRGKGTP